ncbi:MAG: Na+/H+ antiporter NhaA, partial [Acidimicrobiia bacterium]
LAIVDDLGAIIVIAVFYSTHFDARAELVAVGLILAIVGLRMLGVRHVMPYVVLGIGVWIAVHDGGIHATIAGVILGLLAPTRPFRRSELVDADQLADVSSVETAHETVVLARESVSVVEWLEHLLHPWTSYVIVPIFALANAGVVISHDSIDAAVSSPVTHGIVVGLVVGKLIGISACTWLACKIGIGTLPVGTRFSQVVGVAALGGIGFTVSLFVSELAFGSHTGLADESKLGILAASLIAAALGTVVLLATTRRESGPAEAGPDIDSNVI